MKPGFPVLRARVEELAKGAATVFELPHGNRTLPFTRLDKLGKTSIRHMPAFGKCRHSDIQNRRNDAPGPDQRDAGSHLLSVLPSEIGDLHHRRPFDAIGSGLRRPTRT